MNYTEFLESKLKATVESGFVVDEKDLNPALFDFQRYIVKTALRKGRYAIFADCGLGKTLMQLEFARLVVEYTGLPFIILAPLAVVAQTMDEGLKFGIEAVEWREEFYSLHEIPASVYITNYEQLEHLPLDVFGGVALDESSILKNFEGATRNLIIDGFANTPYKLACTATPSPNDPMELGNHSEFLNVLPRNEMLAMYFVHDGGETAKWRLKGHSESVFWQWVSSWAIMLGKPSDIGFSAKGYHLPELIFEERTINTGKRDNGQLFNNVAISATNFNAELRITKIERLDEVAAIVNASTESFIVWIKQNEEGDRLRALIPDAVEVKGSDTPAYKKEKLLGFGRGEFRVLITKTKIAQFGLNYQNCHNQVFAALDFSFEGLYQAIRRSYRFGQKEAVNIYLITTDTMTNVIESIRQKQIQFEKMQNAMQQSMNDAVTATKSERDDRTEYTEHATLMLGDCVQRISEIADDSIGLSVFSPPFAELYTYSSELEDMGNSRNYKEFLLAFGFLVKELYRVLWSGRNVAVHCMDLPIQKGKEGYIGLRDFSGMLLRAFCGISEDERRLIDEVRLLLGNCGGAGFQNEQTFSALSEWLAKKDEQMAQHAGFIYHSRVTIWKNPVTEMQRTKALGLLHKQVRKDAAMSRVGMPDYVMVFRKPGEHLHPVHCDIPVDLWQKYASPVWMDIDYGNTLNGRAGRDERDEKHICPLQLDTIERCIHLWSNEGDTVLTPFGGIGSEVFQALKMRRKAIGIELKSTYFDVMLKNILAAEAMKQQAQLSFA